jgi:hypothetical protein
MKDMKGNKELKNAGAAQRRKRREFDISLVNAKAGSRPEA